MYQRKILIIALVSALIGCSQNAEKKEVTLSQEAPQSPYQLPNTVDYEKAARLNIELGLAYLKQGQVSRAKSKLNRAKTLAPNLPEVHYSYAYYLERVGELKEAEKSYQKALSLNPKGGNEHNNYGAFLCRQHLYKQAEKEFLKAIEDQNYTSTAEALENAGLCIQQVQDLAKASEYFEKALRYDPNRANALLELSIMRFRERKWLEANEYYNRYIQVSKPTARSVLLGIELAKNNGDEDKEASLKLLLNSQFPGTKKEDLYLSRI